MKILALDTETEPFPPVGKVRTTRPCPPLVCVSWAVPGWEPEWERSGVFQGEVQPGSEIQKGLDTSTLVFHNAAFDIPVLEAAGIAPEGGWRKAVLDGRVRDTRVLYKLRYPLKDRPATLAAAYKHVCRKDLPKDSVRTSFRRDRPLTEQQRDYARRDAVATLELYQKLLTLPLGDLGRPDKELEKEITSTAAYNGRDPDLVFSQAAALCSWYLESGLALDRAALAEELATYRQQAGELSAKIVDLGLMRCKSEPGPAEPLEWGDRACEVPPRWTYWRNDDSGGPLEYRRTGTKKTGYRAEYRRGSWSVHEANVRALYAAAAEDLGIDPPLSEKTNKISTSRDFWKQYENELSPPLQVHLAYGKAKKILSAFLEPLEGVASTVLGQGSAGAGVLGVDGQPRHSGLWPVQAGEAAQSASTDVRGVEAATSGAVGVSQLRQSEVCAPGSFVRGDEQRQSAGCEPQGETQHAAGAKDVFRDSTGGPEKGGAGGELESRGSRSPSRVEERILDADRTEVQVLVCPNVFVPGAETGRWAASKPNIMQLPKRLRRLYIAPRGSVFVAADFKSLELYTLAHTMAAMGIKGPLLSALQAGGDVHQATADAMSVSRQEAKVANFGLPGGLGAKKFGVYARGFGLNLTDDEAAELRRAWFAAYPDIKEWMEFFDFDPWEKKPKQLEPEDWLQSLGFDTENETWPSPFRITRKLNRGAVFTVVLPSGRVVPQRHYAAACNFCFQGPGADVITHAFVYCVEAGLEPVAVVHDSLNVVCGAHPDCVKANGEALVKCMQCALADCCPLVPAPLPEYEVSEHLL